MASIDPLRRQLLRGQVIPACPLALNHQRRWSEKHQRALARYYRDAGAGGLAVGVHTTQFAIRNPKIGLYRPILELVRETLQEPKRPLQPKGPVHGSDALRTQPSRHNPHNSRIRAQKPRTSATVTDIDSPPLLRPLKTRGRLEVKMDSEEDRMLLVAGVCGVTRQAVAEAEIAANLGYRCALLSLGALRDATDDQLIAHCRAVADVLPVFGFYLQPAAGGRLLSAGFWRRFCAIPAAVAIKIAPFNRYQTLDVVRAVVESGRQDVALYTGNDDNIVLDLLTPFRFKVGVRWAERRIVGGLLGHWAVWTQRAVELHAACRQLAQSDGPVDTSWLRRANEVTHANAALFDPEHQFAGCIPGIHEVLRRQGLLPGTYCLDPHEQLSPGQRAAIQRIIRDYPHLTDDDFVAEHRDKWLR